MRSIFFSSAGYSVSGMLINVVIAGVVNLVFTLIALRVVDHLMKKKTIDTRHLGSRDGYG